MGCKGSKPGRNKVTPIAAADFADARKRVPSVSSVSSTATPAAGVGVDQRVRGTRGSSTEGTATVAPSKGAPSLGAGPVSNELPLVQERSRVNSGPAHTETIAPLNAQLSDKTRVLNQATAEREATGQHDSSSNDSSRNDPPQLAGKLVIDLTAPVDEVIQVLQAELDKRRPYGDAGGHSAGKFKFKDTVDAQGTLIGKLESDLVAANACIKELRDKYEKRVKRQRVSSAKQKAESEVQVLELKEKLSVACRQYEECKADLDSERVRQAAAAGRPALGSGSSARAAARTASPDSSDDDEMDARAGLILSLSNQIATLDEELRAAHEEITRIKRDHDNQARSTDTADNDAAPPT